MNEPLPLHMHLHQLAVEMRRISLATFGGDAKWRPAVNAFKLSDRFLVCVDLAGMEKPAISVRAEPHRILISGTRPAPEPPHDIAGPSHALAMEIDYGPFERVIELPAEIEPERVTATYRAGLLWIDLPLKIRQPKTIPVTEETK